MVQRIWLKKRQEEIIPRAIHWICSCGSLGQGSGHFKSLFKMVIGKRGNFSESQKRNQNPFASLPRNFHLPTFFYWEDTFSVHIFVTNHPSLHCSLDSLYFPLISFVSPGLGRNGLFISKSLKISSFCFPAYNWILLLKLIRCFFHLMRKFILAFSEMIDILIIHFATSFSLYFFLFVKLFQLNIYSALIPVDS